MTKPKKEKAPKPKYNMFQNSAFMIALAWTRQKWVLWLCLAEGLLVVAWRLISLFIAPRILGAIEAGVPIHELLMTILVFVAAMMLTGIASAYVGTNTIFGRVALRLYLVSQLHEKYMTTSYPNIENQDLLNKLETAQTCVNSNDKASESIWDTLAGLIRNITGFCIYLALLSSLDLWIVALVLATTVVGFFVNRPIGRWGYRHRDENAEHLRRMNYVYIRAEDHTLAKDIRMFGMRGWLDDMYNSSLRLFKAFTARGQRVYIWEDIIDILLTFARNGAAYLYLIGLVLNDGLSAPQFLLYFTAVGGFTSWVGGILSGFETLHSDSLDLSTVREFIAYEEPFRFEDGAPCEPDLKKPYEIQLRDVSFRYPDADVDTLKHINLTIASGEKLAIVGLNGAGKTTLIKLACGFYDPTEGVVLLNGQDIRQYNRRDVYRHFSAVFQDFSLLAGTVAENIAQVHAGALNAALVEECAERAGFAKKVNSLPHRYDTYLGKKVYEDAIELSGGEKQRLLLARALYKNAPIIVLDEPTAALDPIAESDVYNRYHDLTGGRTSIYISHRLASTQFCDRIVYLEDGAITEKGTHDVLLRKNGKYAELFEIQSHYYREGDAEDEQEKNG